MTRTSCCGASFLVSVLCLWGASAAAAEAPQDSDNSFKHWLADRVAGHVQARLEQTNSSTKQVEAPSVSKGSTSLVDQSSASDLLSVAADLAGLNTDKAQSKTNSVSATATTFALYASISGRDPLDPQFYNNFASLRDLQITAGYDEAASGGKKLALYGLKWKFIDRRRLSSNDKSTLVVAMKSYAVVLGRIETGAKEYIWDRPERLKEIASGYRDYITNHPTDCPVATTVEVEVEHLLNNPPWIAPKKCEAGFFTDWNNRRFGASFEEANLSPAEVAKIDEMIGADIETFAQPQEETQVILDKVRRAPQLALSGQRKTLESGYSYTGEAIFDYGLQDKLNLTVNASYVSTTDRANAKATTHGVGKFSAQLRYQLAAETSTRKASYLDFAGDAANDHGATYKAQIKLAIPIVAGLDLPVSVTYANKRELIKERDIRGQVGFTLDFAKLLQAVKRPPA
jgi:hypothetical protein